MAVAFETYVEKYIRLSDDLHEVSTYLSDIRVCLVVLTASTYLAILAYALVLCLRRRPGDGGHGHGHGDEEAPRRPSSTSTNTKKQDMLAAEKEDDWRENSPLRPGAVKTLDGYRYKSPVGTRASGKTSYGAGGEPDSPDLSSRLIGPGGGSVGGRKVAGGRHQYS